MGDGPELREETHSVHVFSQHHQSSVSHHKLFQPRGETELSELDTI